MKASGKTKKQLILEYLLITLGTVLVTCGIYFFKYPNHFATGGVSGISVIVGELVDFITPAQFVLAVNVLLLIVGYVVLGKEFGIRTVYCSLLMSLLLWVFELIIPMDGPFTDQPLLELCYEIFLPGVGSAILFNLGASTGGSDIVALIMKKYFKLEVSTALLMADILVVICAGVVFGIRTALFSMLGLLAKALVVDSVIESINRSKYFIIVSKNPDVISDYINHTLHRGATEWESVGTYTDQTSHMLLVAMNRSQAAQLRQFIKQVDPDAFVLISNTSDIIGKGFKETL